MPAVTQKICPVFAWVRLKVSCALKSLLFDRIKFLLDYVIMFYLPINIPGYIKSVQNMGLSKILQFPQLKYFLQQYILKRLISLDTSHNHCLVIMAVWAVIGIKFESEPTEHYLA